MVGGEELRCWRMRNSGGTRRKALVVRAGVERYTGLRHGFPVQSVERAWRQLGQSIEGEDKDTKVHDDDGGNDDTIARVKKVRG